MDQSKIHREIESIVQQLIYKYRPLKIILFGSAARGEYDKVNDLDFLILKRDVPSWGLDCRFLIIISIRLMLYAQQRLDPFCISI